MKKFNMHNGYARGSEIVTFKRGSWQEAAHAKGMRFFEPIPSADRLERTPAEAEQVAAYAAELVVVDTCAQIEAEMAEQPPAKEMALAS